MALISWLDAMRTFYLTPARSGTPLTLLNEGFVKREYSPEARANLDAGKCTRAIAKPITFEDKNQRERELFGMCLLMKPGSKLTAGNMSSGDFGRAASPLSEKN